MEQDNRAELRELEAVLKKVTRSSWCLICDLQFTDETTVRTHFLNVHQRGRFVCDSFGCKHVAETNGDLRLHYLLWHSETLSSTVLLPVSVRDLVHGAVKQQQSIEFVYLF